MRCPAQLYRPSQRPYQGLPELDYPFHDKAVIVTTCGRIGFNTRKINLSQVFAGQMVGIKQVDERIWLVSFMHYDLGYIDLEQRTLQTLDNPFGPRLSPIHKYVLLPMSPGWTPRQAGGDGGIRIP
jgi:hypothetical protein